MRNREMPANQPKTGKRKKGLPQTSSDDREALIRRRAFQIYEHRGLKPGDATHDWYQAEAEIRAQMIDSGLEDI
jgi:Protein of unknown function (DUF2934).